MPVPTHQQRAPGAAYGSLAATPDFRPQSPSGPYNVQTYQGRSSTNYCNQTQAVARTTPSLLNSSPADRPVQTAPVSKDMQSAQVTPVQNPGVPNETSPTSPSDDEETRSLSPSQMSVDSSTEEGSVKVITSNIPVGPILPTLRVSLKRLNSPQSNQSDCHIVETEPTPDSGSEHLVQKSVSPSPPRKLQKRDQEDEWDGEINFCVILYLIHEGHIKWLIRKVIPLKKFHRKLNNV